MHKMTSKFLISKIATCLSNYIQHSLTLFIDSFFSKSFKKLSFPSIIEDQKTESRETEWGRNVTNYSENMAKTSTF